MSRTIISLDPDDRAWLSRKAKRERTPMTELVRRAVREFRKHSGPEASELDGLLSETAGLWKQGDGLAYQKRLRGEWNKRK